MIQVIQVILDNKVCFAIDGMFVASLDDCKVFYRVLFC